MVPFSGWKPYHWQYFRHLKKLIVTSYIFVRDPSGWMCLSVLPLVDYIIPCFFVFCFFVSAGEYKWTQIHWVAQTSFSAPMKHLMPPRFNKETFPNGSPVAVQTNEKTPSAWIAFPKCNSSSRPQQWSVFLRLCSHVYAFVPHYSASASTDPHLAFKFPDQPGSHALMTWLLLQLNSLCSSYSGKTGDLTPSRLDGLLCDTMLI